MKRKHIIAILAVALTAGLGLTGCTSDAHQVSDNLSKEAEQFRVTRNIVFYNGITDKYVAEVKGRCSVDDSEVLEHTLAVTCKVGPHSYTKDYLGKSDNVTWFALQINGNDVDPYSKEVIFKPETIVPDIRVETSLGK
jgi:hypothetical protein